MQDASVIESLARLLSFSDYNTRVVLLGAAILGFAAGVVGSFMMLRRRAMISDVVSHAALPGIVAAFMVATALGAAGKSLPYLLTGALASGLLGMACIHVITSMSHIKEDAALGIVLSVFFGLGVVLLGLAQRMKTGSAAGLETFIYGKTASMLASDAWLMAGAALAAGVASLVLFKEFRLLCFDPEFARAQGWPVHRLDALMTSLVVMVTVIGLQAVGLILMIALLIIPSAAARFWTDRLGVLVGLSGAIGAGGALLGAMISAVYPDLPAGAMIVLVCSGLFLLSLLAGTRRGLLLHLYRHAGLSARMERHHLLRAIYEQFEVHADTESMVINVEALAKDRHWSRPRLRRMLDAAARDGEIEPGAWPLIRLTPVGLRHAGTVVRNHRLWEWYLISQANIDAGHVDRDADEIEHVLGRDLVAELERTLEASVRRGEIPASPHPIRSAGASAPRSGGSTP